MKSLIRSIFKSRKKIFNKAFFISFLRLLFKKKLQLHKKHKIVKTSVLIQKNTYNSLIIKQRVVLRKYLIEHYNVSIKNLPFILKFIEMNNCLFADLLIIEQLIVKANKKLEYKSNISNNIKPFMWQSFISNQRTAYEEKYYLKG